MNELFFFVVEHKKLRAFSNTPDGSTQRNIYYASRPFHFLCGDNLSTKERPLHERARETRTVDSFITESAIRSTF